MNRSIVMSGRTPNYALHAPNACPTCGASQWFVGRIIAECACCGDTLPINASARPYQMAQMRGIAA